MVRGRFEALGTYGELLLDGRPDALGTAMRILRAELAAIDLACSRFRADSELMAVNAAAGRTVPVSPLFAEAVRIALTAAEQTGGDVDPMLGGALVAAGYDADYAALPADGPAAAPGAAAGGRLAGDRADRATRSGSRPAPRSTSARPPRRWPSTGPPPRSPPRPAPACWSTSAATSPRPARCRRPAGRCGSPTTPRGSDVTRPGRTGPVVRMHGGGLATSSTAVRRWRRGGTAYHHVLDPRTGLPAEPVWRTVTVTAASCVDANTASTAAIVRGRRALDWLAALGLPSRLVDAAGAVHRVAGWPADREDAA